MSNFASNYPLGILQQVRVQSFQVCKGIYSISISPSFRVLGRWRVSRCCKALVLLWSVWQYSQSWNQTAICWPVALWRIDFNHAAGIMRFMLFDLMTLLSIFCFWIIIIWYILTTNNILIKIIKSQAFQFRRRYTDIKTPKPQNPNRFKWILC